MNNIWKVLDLKDLIALLKKSVKKHLMLGIVLETTIEKDTKTILSFMKSKHKEYPNVTFVLFIAKTQDLGKLDKILDKNKTSYPKIFFLYNTKEILVQIVDVNDVEIIKEAYAIVEPYYKKDKIKFLINKDSRDKEREEEEENKNDESGDDYNHNYLENKIDNNIQDFNLDDLIDDDFDKEEIIENTVKPTTNVKKQSPSINDNITKDATGASATLDHQRELLERKKIFEKILLMNEKSKEFTITLLEDIKNRAKLEEEEKIREKEKEIEEREKERNSSKKSKR